jgi:hypothetical protein
MHQSTNQPVTRLNLLLIMSSVLMFNKNTYRRRIIIRSQLIRIEAIVFEGIKSARTRIIRRNG